MTAPTSTTSPSLALISVITPAIGEGTSVSTLSVDTSKRGSSSLTSSPTFLNQRSDRSFGDRLTELGHRDVSHQPCRLLPVSESTVSPNSSDSVGWGWMNSATSATVASQFTAR